MSDASPAGRLLKKIESAQVSLKESKRQSAEKNGVVDESPYVEVVDNSEISLNGGNIAGSRKIVPITVIDASPREAHSFDP